MSENPNPTPPADGGEGEQAQTFTQAELDKIVKDRIARERAKFADYDDLKAKAGEKATADERIAALEEQVKQSAREAMKRRAQAAHGISDEDADLFLTGTDEETLAAQAKRLADRTAERAQSGNRVPSEGTNPKPTDDPMRAFARELFKGD